MNKTILALDTATHNCGYAVLSNLNVVNSGVITSVDKDINKRLSSHYGSILSLINDYNVDIVVFENTNTFTNIQTLKMLAQLQGIIMAICISRQIEYYTMLPTEWRAVLGFKTGNKTNRVVQKQLALDYVNLQVGINTSNDDEAEAICLGIAYLKKGGIV
jgi:Holliday junction resolvasome RuvABC endonuclease subunit